MSLVTVHGPNTMYTTEGGGASIPSSGGGIAQATKSPSNGLVYSFSVPNPGARPAADFDWTFTGPGSPAAQTDRFSGTVTYTGAGAGTIVLTVAAGAGPPAGGTYTITTAPTAGVPRMIKPETQEAPSQQSEPEPQGEVHVDAGFDPAAHTVQEVLDYVESNPDEAADILALERASKDRTTLINHLEALVPFDPAEYSVADVEAYVNENPDEAQAVLDAEAEGKNRSTLVSFLEARLGSE